MNSKNTLVALVLLVLVAVGYYFWKKKKDEAKENEAPENDNKALGVGVAPALPVGTRPLKSTEMPSKITLVDEPKLGGYRPPQAPQYVEPLSPIKVMQNASGETRIMVNPNGGMVQTVNPNQMPTSIVNPTKMPTIPGTKVGSIVYGHFANPFTAQPHFAQAVLNAVANTTNPVVANSMVPKSGGRG